ncbi:autophagy-related protein 23-like [Leptopilina heterotoma]|uniref:autophagy-related protein 23-like n=1 Tax=Leptopilina heterotoma TaxID=63436 RepID=UPI001CA93D3D|nr:autophagy-related protein 23-like [Leptopilina heterotoma]
MFAGVKYSRSCLGHEDIDVINISEIKSKFNPANFDSNKLFYIKCSVKGKCSAFVMFITNTKKEALEKMKTDRPKYPPISKSIPPSSESETEKSNKKETHGKSFKRVFNRPSEEISPMLQLKIEKLQGKYLNKVREETTPTTKKHTNSINDNNDDTNISNSDYTDDNDDVDDDDNNGGTSEDDTFENDNNGIDGILEENSITQDKLRITDIKRVNVDNIITADGKKRKLSNYQDYENYDLSPTEVGRLKEEVALLRNQITMKNKQIAEMRKDLDEKNTDIQDLRRRNAGLQDKLLSRLNELDKNIEDIEVNCANAVGKRTFDKVGSIKKNKVHLGNDIWLEQSKYDVVAITSRTPKIFINKLAEACFGFQILINSSVTGKVSNRTRKINSIARPRLDPQKICAIQESFENWAEKCTPPYDKSTINVFKNDVPIILSQYITKLRERHCKRIANNGQNAVNPTNIQHQQENTEETEKEVHQLNENSMENDTDVVDKELEKIPELTT